MESGFILSTMPETCDGLVDPLLMFSTFPNDVSRRTLNIGSSVYVADPQADRWWSTLPFSDLLSVTQPYPRQ